MVRRLFVPVILAALIVGVAPSPSFALGERAVRPSWGGDHFRCMYRCEDRGFEPPPRRYGWGSWNRPHAPRPPARPSWNRHRCWLFCGHDGWGHGGAVPFWWCGPGPYYRHGWYGPGRHCRPGGHGHGHGHGHDHDRYDRHRDRDDSGGYNAHRHHPRGRDF